MIRRNPRFYNRTISSPPTPLTPEQVGLMTTFVQSEGYINCLNGTTLGCNPLLYIDENIPVDLPAARAFINEQALRGADSAFNGVGDLAEEMLGDLEVNEIEGENEEQETLPAAEDLPESEEPVEAEATPPIPSVPVVDSADQAYPFIRQVDTVVLEGNEPITPIFKSTENLYNPALLNTQGIIYLKQYTIDTNETGAVFKFQYAPQDISWQRNATLETDAAWGTNVQPKHFTATTGKKLNLNNIIIEGMTLNNIVTNSIKALEILMSINENANASRVTPYCYKLIIGDRVFSDPMSGRHIPFVITSLQVKEEEYTLSGDILAASVNIALEEIPWYQVNDGRKLMLLFEDTTTEEENNCEQLANQIQQSAKTLEELATKWNGKPRPADLSNYENSAEQAEMLTDCATLNQEFLNLLQGVEAQRAQSCENLETGGNGAEAYNELWGEEGYLGYFLSEAGDLSYLEAFGGGDPSLGSIIRENLNPLNIFRSNEQKRDSAIENKLENTLGPSNGCRPINDLPPDDLANMRAGMQETLERIKAGNSCDDLYSEYLGVYYDAQARQGLAFPSEYGSSDDPNRRCLSIYNDFLNRTSTNLEGMQNPEQKAFQELQNRSQAREAMDYFASEYNRLLEESNGSFSQLDEEACLDNDACALWKDYDSALTSTATTFGLDDYLNEIFNLEEEAAE